MYTVILLSWVIFGVIHSVTASVWLKQRFAARFSHLYTYYRLMYNGIALLTLPPILWLHRIAPVDYVSAWQGSFLTGSLVIGIGVVIAIIALRGYDLAEFIGWPVTSKQAGHPELRQNGLLRYMRHPLYTGTILALAGIWIAQPTWSYLLLFLAATLYIRVGVYFEERKLIATFGTDYRVYRQHVPMLIPRLSRPSKE